MDTVWDPKSKYYKIEEKPHQGKERQYVASETRLIDVAESSGYWTYEELTKDVVIAMYGSLNESEIPAELLEKLEESDTVIEVQNSENATQYFLPQDAPSKIEWALDELGHDLPYFRAEPITANEALNFKLKSI